MTKLAKWHVEEILENSGQIKLSDIVSYNLDGIKYYFFIEIVYTEFGYCLIIVFYMQFLN